MSALKDVLEREDFASRLGANQSVSMIEMLYPLLQAMDSVAIEADIEIGGSDQLWNLLVGRYLQGRSGQRPQLAVTAPLLVGTDAVKSVMATRTLATPGPGRVTTWYRSEIASMSACRMYCASDWSCSWTRGSMSTAAYGTTRSMMNPEYSGRRAWSF